MRFGHLDDEETGVVDDFLLLDCILEKLRGKNRTIKRKIIVIIGFRREEKKKIK